MAGFLGRGLTAGDQDVPDSYHPREGARLRQGAREAKPDGFETSHRSVSRVCCPSLSLIILCLGVVERKEQVCVTHLHLPNPNPNLDTNYSIKFLRMSSEMFPFASHSKFGYDLGYVDAELKGIGALAKQYGHRLTSHPGQFTQIASPKEHVVEAAVKDLDCGCSVRVESQFI